MEIIKKSVWVVGGKPFDTLQKAVDDIENKINLHVVKSLKETNHWQAHGAVTQYLLDNRHELAELLGYELPQGEGNDE